MSAIAPVRSAADLPSIRGFDLLPKPQTLDEVMRFATLLSESDLVPKDFRGKPGNVLLAVQMGVDVGLSWAQALQNIAVINGRPAMWGDAVLAIARSSPAFVAITEECDGTTATCTVTRRGEEPVSRSFSLDDAKQAQLIGKAGPWTQYPKRMLQMRARAWCLRDVFPDVLKGLAVREEVIDAEYVEEGGASSASPSRAPRATTLAERVAATRAEEPAVAKSAEPAGNGGALEKMIEAFSRIGIHEADIEERLGLEKPIDEAILTEGEMADLRDWYAEVKNSRGAKAAADHPVSGPDPQILAREIIEMATAARSTQEVDEAEDLLRELPGEVRAKAAGAVKVARARVGG